jgi:DNA-nicking Smr family endonuclease
MNFGEILDKWERGQSQTSKTYMRDNENFYRDSDVIYKKPIPGENRRRLLNEKPDDVIDIHGLTTDKAWISLDLFFNRARSCGFQKLRIIHGKGNHSQGDSVLGQTVRAFIEQCPYAGESGFEKISNGGTGATWVLLKDF